MRAPVAVNTVAPLRLTTRRKVALGLGLALVGALVLAPAALADNATEGLGFEGRLPQGTGLNSTFVLIAAMLVMFMQAGFAALEIGFVRAKNAGSVIAKILTNFAICGIFYWAIGFAIAFSHGNPLVGLHGWFLAGAHVSASFPLAYPNTRPGVTVETLAFFQFTFCAVALAIVWGTTLERIKFGVYVIYAVIFSAFIYPIVSHWIFAGGWLAKSVHMQDFAGAVVVDVTGATAALAVLLLLGPRKGKYGPGGTRRVIPGHSMPMFGIGILILWLGWFGFNPGSTLNALDGRFATVALITNLAGCGGVLAALGTIWLRERTFDIGMAGNGAIAGLVAITGSAGYVSVWAAPLIGAVAGVIVVLAVLAIDRKID
ncbi:MAG: ammonium transporter, Amt family, partial [Thermoleophilaceae bacterium]|nr:ammonium transporter, Amt family [Thermoleophilaceae bacterium]